MSEETKVEYHGQCETWWDARTCQMVDWPRHIKPDAPTLIQIMRCVLEAGHEETAGEGNGHNFGGLGPYTPGMPGWKAQQRALGLPDERPRGVEEQYESGQCEAPAESQPQFLWASPVTVGHPGHAGLDAALEALGVPPLSGEPDVVAREVPEDLPPCVKWEGHNFPNGATCRKCETYWIEQRSALFAANPWSWMPPAEPGPEVRRVRPVERYPGDDGIRYDREPDNSGWRLVMMGRRGEVIEWLQVLAGAGGIYGGRQLIDATSELAEEGREG